MKLLEILKQSYPWKIISETETETIYEFIIDDDSTINVNFYRMDFFDKNFIPIELTFSRRPKGFGPSIEITGEGDAFKIYATIIEIIKNYVNSNKFDVLYFSAKEKSRRSLYLKIIKKFADESDFSFVNYEESYYVGKNLDKHLENIKLMDKLGFR